MTNKWSEDELQFIKDNYETLTDAEIAEKLGRTESAVATKRKRLSLQRSKRKYSWNDVVEAFSKTDLILVSGEEDYKDSATNSLRYICPKHRDKGVMTIALGHLLNGEGCYYCGRESSGKKRMIYLDEKYYKKLCDERDFTYLGAERINGNICVKFICNKHVEYGEQYQRIGNLKRRKFCQYCGGASYGEEKICSLLKEWGYSYRRQHIFPDCKDKYVLPFDFYIKNYNVCIEYDGEQHYEPIYGEENLKIVQRHDEIKNDYCRKNNIPLIRIPYWERDDISNYLFDEFLRFGIVELIC